ncbi:IST1-like protein [Linum perenne]
MFDSLTKSKFYTKCKSLTKMTKVRLDSSIKKKKAVAKYLRNDIADLLQNGLDSNAYGRAEGLIVEQNMVAAYKFIDEFCDCISTNLATLDKQMECPKDCREAIQCLMYAAARLAEFPELRDLRSVFAQRYGDRLELYLNKEFGELLNPKPATKEMKLQLLGDVAKEFSIKWDPNFIDQKLSKPTNPSPAPAYVRAKSDSTSTRRTAITASASEDDKKQPYKFIPPPYVISSNHENSPPPKSTAELLQQKPRSVRRMKPVLPDHADADEEERKLDELLMQQTKRGATSERSFTKTASSKPLSWQSRDSENRREEVSREGPSRHVHPNLPDYDSLADRIASFKGI